MGKVAVFLIGLAAVYSLTIIVPVQIDDPASFKEDVYDQFLGHPVIVYGGSIVFLIIFVELIRLIINSRGR